MVFYDLGCVVCSQRVCKLLKRNINVEVLKACNIEMGYTSVIQALLGVIKLLIYLYLSWVAAKWERRSLTIILTTEY